MVSSARCRMVGYKPCGCGEMAKRCGSPTKRGGRCRHWAVPGGAGGRCKYHGGRNTVPWNAGIKRPVSHMRAAWEARDRRAVEMRALGLRIPAGRKPKGYVVRKAEDQMA